MHLATLFFSQCGDEHRSCLRENRLQVDESEGVLCLEEDLSCADGVRSEPVYC